MTSAEGEPVPLPRSINIRPSPRILRVLGDIEFEPWQCIAELIDNAFDDFLEIYRSGTHWPDGFNVSVSLPNRAGADATIVIEDTGRGMSIDTLNNAVRAGWSSNDRFSKLGLFGMGFNIATARLGRVARVFTTRTQDTEWLGVEIDLDKIGDDFEVPLVRRPKATPSEHGTIVEITSLEPSRAGWLGKNAAKIRATLGDVYSYLLSSTPFHLYIDSVRVTPKRACIWDDTRSVTYGSGSTAEQIPAVLKIDERLPDAEACLTCGNWQQPQLGKCSECGAATLEPRSRRIHGWLGIQRHLHKSEFGIDFLRNGRKILRYDKRLFSWTDPNDPLAAPETEYPVELGQGGRIVGEIHLDHIPVNYQKNAFEWSDRQWIAAVRFLRGNAPLLPKRARDLGYPPNETPLARLHRGYRRTDPGYRCLIPGNGAGPIHADTLEWRDKFHKGIPEYQADTKWWDAVVYHEAKLAGMSTINTAPGSDVLAELGLDATPLAAVTANESSTAQPVGNGVNAQGLTSAKAKTSAVSETEKERADRLRASGEVVPSLSKDFGLTDLGSALEVTTFAVREPLVDANGAPTPVWLWRESGKRHIAFVNITHPVFQSFPVDPGILLSVEIANHLRVRADSKLTVAQVTSQIIEQRLTSLRVEQAYLAGQARDLLAFVRQRMSDAVATNPDRAWQHLSIEERATTETNMVVAGSATSLEQLQKSGEFLLHVPATFIPRLAEEWPDAFFDGKVFKGGYSTVKTAAGKHIVVGRVVSYLYDAAVVAEVKLSSPVALSRCALSIQLLRAELARGGEQ
jgi:hypothetical protein